MIKNDEGVIALDQAEASALRWVRHALWLCENVTNVFTKLLRHVLAFKESGSLMKNIQPGKA